MMFRQLKVGERLQPFTGTTGQGQAAMLVIAVVDFAHHPPVGGRNRVPPVGTPSSATACRRAAFHEGVYEPERSNAALTSGHRWNEYRSSRRISFPVSIPI